MTADSSSEGPAHGRLGPLIEAVKDRLWSLRTADAGVRDRLSTLMTADRRVGAAYRGGEGGTSDGCWFQLFRVG